MNNADDTTLTDSSATVIHDGDVPPLLETVPTQPSGCDVLCARTGVLARFLQTKFTEYQRTRHTAQPQFMYQPFIQPLQSDNNDTFIMFNKISNNSKFIADPDNANEMLYMFSTFFSVSYVFSLHGTDVVRIPLPEPARFRKPISLEDRASGDDDDCFVLVRTMLIDRATAAFINNMRVSFVLHQNEDEHIADAKSEIFIYITDDDDERDIDSTKRQSLHDAWEGALKAVENQCAELLESVKQCQKQIQTTLRPNQNQQSTTDPVNVVESNIL